MNPAHASPPGLAPLVRDEQLRLHRQTLPAAIAASTALGLILAFVQFRLVALAPMLVWLAGLALDLAVRVALALLHRRGDAARQQDPRWLARYRLVTLVHGLVWVLASVLLFPPSDIAHQVFLVFVLAGACVGSLTGYAFDPKAALLFCVPVLLALAARLLLLEGAFGLAMGAPVLLLMAYVYATARRSHRALRETVGLRASQAARLDALRRAQERSRGAEQLARLGSFEWDPASGGLQWSDGHFRLWGLEPGSVAPSLELFRRGVHQDDRARVDAAFEAGLRGEAGPDCAYRVCWPDGSVHHVVGRSEAVKDDAGRMLALRGSVQDVTQRVLVETRLAEKQQLLAVVQQSAQLGFWFLDQEGRTTDVNPAMCTLLGCERSQLLGRSIFLFVEPRQQAWLRQVMLERPADGAPGREIDLIRQDGVRVHCLSHVTPVLGAAGEPLGLVCMFSDMSVMEQTREALRASEFVVNSVNDMVSVTDLHGIYRFVNDGWCIQVGKTREQVIGRPIEEVMPEVMTPERRTALKLCLERNEMRVVQAPVRFDGLGVRIMETTMTPYVTRGKDVRGVVAVTRDVTEQAQVQEALATSLENLRRTFNATADGMIAYDALDPAGRLLFVNDRFFAMWGIPPEQARQAGRDEVLAVLRGLYLDAQDEERRIAAVLEIDQAHTDRLELRDGRILERRSVPMKDGNGATRVWTYRDITLQEQAAEALRANEGQQRALMDAFPGYVGVFDQDFVYTYVNARLAALIGQPAGAIIGRHVRDVLGEAWYQQSVREVERSKSGEHVVAERVFEATPARPRVDLQLTHVMGARGRGRLQRYYSFGVNITELKRAQEALRAAKEDAEHANRAKSAFLASVSHELRTPLNAILGFSQLLRNETEATQAATDNAGEIERAGRHLLALVDDLIDLGGVEAGHLELTMERVSVETMINESLSMVAPLAANQGIRIVFDGGDARNAVVLADAVRLRQIIINLLSNAIKYNRPEGTVRVSCFHRPKPDDMGNAQVRIAVRDTGIGIAPELASRVFSPFERLGAERGQVEGTGIGLAIARRLVSAMGGSIGYESRVEQGSTFWLDLASVRLASPAGRQIAASGARAVQPLLHKTRPRLLVAEDYGPNQAVLKLQLASLGCTVDVVTDGLAALEKAGAIRYDLILSDLDMPHMGGHDLARAVRRHEALRGGHVPIIALSAAVLAGERARCIAAGMDDMLTKPITLEGLAAMLERWLGDGAAAPAATAPAAQPGAAASGLPDAQAPVLDLQALYRVLGRVSVGQARELLATFLTAADAGLVALERSGHDAAVLAREMHRQQSSALTVGAMQYAELARALERSALDAAPPRLAHWLDLLRTALQRVRREAAVLAVQEPASIPAPLADEDVASQLCGSVLVVDDDPVVLMQMQQMLASIGVAEVLSARNGADAIVQMNRRELPVEVVVCDLNMPEMDGVEMIRLFGQSGFRGGLILMSGADEQLLSTVGNLAQMQGLSVLGQIQKPATPELMRTLLRRSAAVRLVLPPAGSDSVMTPEAILAGMRAGEFSIWLQPKVDANTLAAIGVEALARWRQPDGSYVSPDLFIVVAERAGIIGELSGMLLATALREGARLHAAGFHLAISLNLSALWLDDLSLPDLLLRSAQDVGLAPADIVLEVTETGVTKDIAVALDVLSRLRLKGFGLSIDDFGIGYSSFEQLGRIPFTEMKLDRSFVKRANQDSAARAILESSMAMAVKLELTTVAEGVETEAELALMRELGFDEVQGYLIAKPMPCEQLVDWLRLRQS